MIFTEDEIRYLAAQTLGRVATQQPDGTLQNSPVLFRYNPATQTVDIAGDRMETSRKFRNVAANGRVALVVDDLVSTRPWRARFLEVRGWAEAVTATEAPGRDPVVAGAFLRIHPTRVLARGIEGDGAGGTRARDVAPAG
jgi:pyridoxamine 5'-phosphate oxidase family protein